MNNQPNQPSQPTSPAAKGCGGCFVIVLVIWLLYAMVSCGSQESAEDKQVEMKQHAALVSRRFVEQYLKAPSTAKFPNSYDVEVTQSGDKYIINSYVDAQNSFGAQIRSTYYCEMKYIGPDEFGYSCESLSIDGEQCIGGQAR